MNIKLGKLEAKIPLSVVIVGGLIVDNIVANLCKKKAYDTYAEKVVEVVNSSNSEES